MKDKRNLIVTIIWGTVLMLIGLGFIIGGIIQKSKVLYFGIIMCALFGGLYTYKIIAAAKELKRSKNPIVKLIGGTEGEEQIKENLANYAFDNLMKEGEDYTVEARVPGAKLVKTVVRWASFMQIGQGIEAIFSIETDKVVACFQMQGTRLMRIDSEICTSMYPMLKPE